jgi:hypothetical protein
MGMQPLTLHELGRLRAEDLRGDPRLAEHRAELRLLRQEAPRQPLLAGLFGRIRRRGAAPEAPARSQVAEGQ